jgi:hypothetical protein
VGYKANNLSVLQNTIGGVGRTWFYWTSDSISTVLGAGYISDADKHRMQIGDVVQVLSGTLNTTGPDQSPSTHSRGTVSEFASDPSLSWMVVDSISSGAATLKEVAVELGSQVGFFGAAPVSQPSGAAQNAITDNSGGTSADTIAVGAGYQLQTVRLTLASLANGQEYQFDPGFAGKLVSINARVVEAATTAAKAATLTGRVNAGALGGGGVIGLTSANCTPIGAQIAGSAITGANSFTNAQTVGFTCGSVTTFVEGAIVVEMLLQNTDLTAAIAKFAAMDNKIRTDLVALGLWKGSA